MICGTLKVDIICIIIKKYVVLISFIKYYNLSLKQTVYRILSATVQYKKRQKQKKKKFAKTQLKYGNGRIKLKKNKK